MLGIDDLNNACELDVKDNITQKAIAIVSSRGVVEGSVRGAAVRHNTAVLTWWDFATTQTQLHGTGVLGL